MLQKEKIVEFLMYQGMEEDEATKLAESYNIVPNIMKSIFGEDSDES